MICVECNNDVNIYYWLKHGCVCQRCIGKKKKIKKVKERKRQLTKAKKRI